MKKVVTNPISNIPVAPKSHTRGWSELWSNLLEADIDHKCSSNILSYETIFIEHGVNFGGTLNLFGGATQDLFERINTFCKAVIAKNVISLDIEMPNYGEMLRGRIGAKTTYIGITNEWCDQVSKCCVRVKCLKQENIASTGITIGDSHSTAFSAKGDIVFRNNGKTLFGTLRTGLANEFRDIVPAGKNITFSLGSIDIRHHILRHPNFKLSDMLNDYVRQADAISDETGAIISFAAPVPVEYEERKLPKTGYYKGVPFTGTRQQRFDLTIEFIERLKEISKGRVIMPPEEWYYMDPKQYAETHMEMGGSVHIAPIYYRNKNWNETKSLY